MQCKSVLECEVPFQAKVLYSSNDLHVLLESGDYLCIDLLFQFIAEYVYRETGSEKTVRLREINTLYYEISADLCFGRRVFRIMDEWIAWLRKFLEDFNKKIMTIFKDYQKYGLLTTKVHILNHLREELAIFAICRFWMQPVGNISMPS